jgi:hypothetical protein
MRLGGSGQRRVSFQEPIRAAAALSSASVLFRACWLGRCVWGGGDQWGIVGSHHWLTFSAASRGWSEGLVVGQRAHDMPICSVNIGRFIS